MATDVQVHVTDIAVITALNTPGGAIFEWRDQVAAMTINLATLTSPVNDVLNALHRGGVVGTYMASWGFDRVGSNGHTVRATIYNSADHADIVEFGRRRSTGAETFSWRQHEPPGDESTHAHGTSGRDGNHVLERATDTAVAIMTL